MNSKEIKNAFAAAGIKVRVKAIRGNRFRICRLNDEAHNVEVSNAVAASLGLTDALGKPGATLLQPWEMVGNA